MAGCGRARSFPAVLDDVFASAHAACLDPEVAADVTRRVLVAGATAAAGARLAAGHHPVYAALQPHDRDAVVLARVFGWTTERIALELDTTAADVRSRIARGLRTLLPRRDCAGAASPGRGGRAS
jgi:DNA-directed RNA polymerase specialized sigma24 family protein